MDDTTQMGVQLQKITANLPAAERTDQQRYELIIITLSNGHIIPVKLDRQTGDTWQGHLIAGNLSWRTIGHQQP